MACSRHAPKRGNRPRETGAEGSGLKLQQSLELGTEGADMGLLYIYIIIYILENQMETTIVY